MTDITYEVDGVMSTTQILINGTTNTGYIALTNQTSDPSATVGALNIYSNNSGQMVRQAPDGFTRTFADSNTANRIYTFPDTTGDFSTNDSTATLTNKTIVGGSSGNVVSANQLLGVTLSGVPSTGQVLTYNGSAWNSSSPATGALASQMWIIKDIKTIGTNGGQFIANTWVTRDLNNLSGSGIGCSLSSNQFTLNIGTYYIQARVPAVDVGYHGCKLYNITTASDIAFGSTIQGGNIFESTYSLLDTFVTIGSSTVYEIRHRCTQGSPDKTGFGVASGFMSNEIYTSLIIQKLN